MEKIRNKQILLANRPDGMPVKEDFEIREADIPALKQNEVLTRNMYVSVDPYMRGRMTGIHELIKGRAIGRVVESKSPKFKKNDYVAGMTGWETYSVSEGEELESLDPEPDLLSAYLGVLGMTGLTAYFGLLDIGQPKKGETVVISAAAGAVGNVVGQIAGIMGCRVVGITGRDAKVKMLEDELHFDRAVNYNSTDNLAEIIGEYCPDGVDIYFDNVGGDISDAVMTHLNRHARIPVCGQISLYNLEEIPRGPRIQPLLLAHSARMEGFMVRNFTGRFPEARKQLAAWLNEGKLKSLENVINGFEKIPAAFIGLFTGENTGKQIVRISE